MMPVAATWVEIVNVYARLFQPMLMSVIGRVCRLNGESHISAVSNKQSRK